MAKFIEEDALEDEELDQEELEDRGDNLEDEEDLDDDLENEDEEDLDDNPEDEDEEEELPVKKEPRIPKSRFDEVIQQREEFKDRSLWLETQLDKLISQTNKTSEKEVVVDTSTYDFDKAEEDYISLIIEGEIAKATKLRNEINKQQKLEMMNVIKGIESSMSTKNKNESSALLEDERFNTLIDTLESKNPFLDSKSKEYNEEAVDTVNTLLAGYIAAGKSKTEGLRLAVAKVTPLYKKDITPSKQSLGNKRTVEAGKKAVKAATSQPTKVKNSTSTKAVDNSDINVAKISEKEFAKLTAKERSILRGD